MTHIERAKSKLGCAHSRKRRALLRQIEFCADSAVEMAQLNARREEIADADFEIEAWTQYLAKWEGKVDEKGD